MTSPVKIFFCYAREDEALLNKLKAHLKPLQRQKLIDFWHDRDISAGTEWEQAIKEQLNTAQIILLLISPDFMASEYCYSVEMERRAQGEVEVIPIILRHVYWQGEPLGKLQALPTDGIPVTDSYEQSIQLDSNYGLAYTGKGDSLAKLERYQDALKSYEQAISLNPNESANYRGKELVYEHFALVSHADRTFK